MRHGSRLHKAGIRRGALIVAMLALMALLLAACGEKTPIRIANDNIATGTTQSEAQEILDGLAWHHQTCAWGEGDRDDLTFVSSREDAIPELVIAYSLNSAGEKVVQSITFFEPDAWQEAYADCMISGE